ncbi:alpha/beta hydrolase [Streptomyces sp. SID13666]|uniref:alpha/beta hydrolase n=1 Tax=Streptomyces TaxID=1883 RepID=UPI00110689A7|nr:MULTISPECIES: alpha/beta hydrolase [Streptomyces]MCZ4099644.1 alpha/beta hydrolase [Streptomyces sp. H39-C1]NEA58881.1 alpha/beta hydrolase [Streptomyces sp. SID13666]NEA72941.1 alpha/beta hydrolase [Streptomyces sp. SID13588]QNA74960.1 alpha/beta hydrolase [Streptomyces sp. So13.3]
MASQALTARDARLGRPVAPGLVPAPRRETGETVRAVVLVLPGGDATSTRRRSPLAAALMWPLARHLVREGRADGLAAHVVHYRYRGWNGGNAHPAEDAAWAVGEIVRRYGDVPVCLVGMDMGARAALHAAGHPAVNSVVALSPWLPPGEEPDPVKQLIGRQVLIAHGTDDFATDPELSYLLAERAKKVNRDVCRFEVHTDGHTLHQHRAEIFALTTDFTLGALLDRPFARPIADALAAPPPLGLRMPLASGFGQSLHH